MVQVVIVLPANVWWNLAGIRLSLLEPSIARMMPMALGRIGALGAVMLNLSLDSVHADFQSIFLIHSLFLKF